MRAPARPMDRGQEYWSNYRFRCFEAGPPFRLGLPNMNGTELTRRLTTNSPMSTHNTIPTGVTMTENVKDMTTIQLTAATRDRLYPLKLRNPYDEFLRELC